MPIQMVLRRIIVSELDDSPVIVLHEADGERNFSIVIGVFEAINIKRRVMNAESPRPLTHDLIVSSIEQLGGDIQDVVINDLVDGTYFAKLRVKKDGELIELDCRPSDAIAVALAAKVTIWVSEEVFGEATDENDMFGERDDDDDSDDDDDEEGHL
ncbi:MAG: bifunctional nuclease family protein [Gemmataceae bacterium]